MMRFSPTKGTTSATVPKATISKSSKYHSPYFVSHKAWHNLKATPTPDKFLSLYGQSFCLWLITAFARGIISGDV